MYSFKEKRALTKIESIKIDHARCSTTNFPIKSFHSAVTGDCLTFYRQGFGVTVNSNMESHYEQLTDSDLGSMYLLFDEALVARSSSSILFFKINKDKTDGETGSWKQYFCLNNVRGQIYFIKGNIRIQVITDDKISFYTIDKDKKDNKPPTFLPTLENSMNNDMHCSMMMFGKAVRYCVTYKSSSPGFRVYKRKFYHNFKVTIDASNFEGSQGVNLGEMKAYAIATRTQISVYSAENFKKL